jgi:hypothetical protein
MSAKAKRNKKYRPRSEGQRLLKTQPWKIAAVFNPLEAILNQLEQQGTIDVETYTGRPIFKDHNDGHWYESPVAIMGVVDAYAIHEQRRGIDLDMAPLRQLAKKLDVGMPIFPSDTASCRECLKRMKAETMTMTADYARGLIVDFQIKEELQKIAA